MVLVKIILIIYLFILGLNYLKIIVSELKLEFINYNQFLISFFTLITSNICFILLLMYFCAYNFFFLIEIKFNFNFLFLILVLFGVKLFIKIQLIKLLSFWIYNDESYVMNFIYKLRRSYRNISNRFKIFFNFFLFYFLRVMILYFCINIDFNTLSIKINISLVLIYIMIFNIVFLMKTLITLNLDDFRNILNEEYGIYIFYEKYSLELKRLKIKLIL